jgi:hypothetical protein
MPHTGCVIIRLLAERSDSPAIVCRAGPVSWKSNPFVSGTSVARPATVSQRKRSLLNWLLNELPGNVLKVPKKPSAEGTTPA